jgi:hypothetical protein
MNSHGMPGIFIRYEISPLKITVKEIRRSYWMLLIEIGGIFGGVYATSGSLELNLTGKFFLIFIL